jgi:membrane protein YdbS with pleckstrin-like domain
MSAESSDPGHGHSPAAWTAIIIMLIGVIAGVVAFWFDQPWVVLGSVVVVIIGPIVGLIMAKAGYGVNGPKYQHKGH